MKPATLARGTAVGTSVTPRSPAALRVPSRCRTSSSRHSLVATSAASATVEAPPVHAPAEEEAAPAVRRYSRRGAAPAAPAKPLHKAAHDLPGGGKLSVLAMVDAETQAVRVSFSVDDAARSKHPSLLLHWGLLSPSGQWVAPSSAVAPPGSTLLPTAAQTQLGSAPASVELSLPTPLEPEGCTRLVFVLNSGRTWVNKPGGGDFSVPLVPPPSKGSAGGAAAAELLARACAAETHDGTGVPERLRVLLEVVPELKGEAEQDAPACPEEAVGVLFAWLRLSSLRLLPQAGHCNQPKEIAHLQGAASWKVACLAARGATPAARALARATLGLMPRGGGNGDDIRMEILNIMRNHGIKEGHRNGIDDPFIEAWHQKLHTRTGPDDIAVCEAYLRFLRSGNAGDFYSHLWEGYGITKEHVEKGMRLPSPGRCDGNMAGSFEHYLGTLRRTHGGAALDSAFSFASARMSDGQRWEVGDLLKHRDAPWAAAKCVALRSSLAPLWRPQPDVDALQLDAALEAHCSRLVARETAADASPSRDRLIELLTTTLANAGAHGEWPEVGAAAAAWARLGASEQKWDSPAWVATAAAAAELASRAVEHAASVLGELSGGPTAAIAAAARLGPEHGLNAAEELARGAPFAPATILLRLLRPQLRAASGSLSPWTVASAPPAASGGVVRGSLRLASLASLASASSSPSPEPIILVSPTGVEGTEDVPPGVAALLTGCSLDALSHLALRCRAQGVLLAYTDDAEALATAAAAVGDGAAATVTVVASTGDVRLEAAGDASAAAPAAAAPPTQQQPPGGEAGMSLPPVSASPAGTWVLPEASFAPGVVGGKALGCARLRAALDAASAPCSVPPSQALPFRTFEAALAWPGNAAPAAEVSRLKAALAADPSSDATPALLKELRDVVSLDLEPPPELADALRSAIAALLLPPAPSPDAGAEAAAAASAGALLAPSWAAVCDVWASAWTDRGWRARRAARLPLSSEDDFSMSVLMQPLVHGVEYAFVVHTRSPLQSNNGGGGAEEELYGEMVAGLGEALVGAWPGRALSFTAAPAAAAAGGGGGGVSPSPSPRVLALPSKLHALRPPRSAAPSLIFRSDSNGEDLDGFAGAGLYESIIVSGGEGGDARPPAEEGVDYASERLWWDAAWREAALARVAAAGWAVKRASSDDSDWDIEGCVTATGEVTVVQARPQVG